MAIFINHFLNTDFFGAVEKTRTSTLFTEQRPQRCASTNSATTAHTRVYLKLFEL